MQSSLARGVLLVSVVLSLALSVFAEPSDRLLEVDSLIRLHRRVNVRAGNKVPTSPGTPRSLSQPPSPTTTTTVTTAPSLVHSISSSSSTTLNTDPTLRSSTSSSSSITLKKEKVHSHDHGTDKDKDKGKEEHKPEDHTHNPDDIVAHDIGIAELKAIHEIMDKLFPEEAHIEQEAKAFELQKAQLKLDNLKKTEIKSKGKTEKKPTHGFSTPVLDYLQGIWSSHKSTKKLRTYYSKRVASVNSQIDFAIHEWTVTQQKKFTVRQLSALVAFLAYELRHRARLVTRWVQDVSGSSCQVKFVASARKRDQKEYGHPDGPTFGWLVTRKIKSIKGSCKKLNSKFPSTDDDFVLVYESIVKSSKKPNGFLNFVLNVGGSKKTKKSGQFVHPISTSSKRKFEPLESPSSPESPTPTSPLLTDFKFEDFEEPCSRLEHSELLLLEHVMDVQIKELISEEDISCDTSTTSLILSSPKDSPRKK